MKNLNVDKVTKAIEADAGQPIAGLRESLEQAKRGEFAAVHTPEAILARRKPGRPVGSAQAVTKKPVQIRLDADVLDALRATGDGWQTRVNDTLRANLVLAGKL
ncbi:BrnA antitoxin family protein [Ottowia testudinis]|uniref:BrnA antitoxin family protein n=1 Tax=Ottowia testudinis TaxID=2816950 RepID=A0A975CD45_9BURK|nr:BrnA antitoxin family protein [Ottowia testudinis]QTD44195.1 BrnA antitoxin family protein [Ottowia testudinis]